jgi:hypothetical protein
MAKDMKISIGADQVMYSTISKSKDGYNSARLVAKINDKEYMSVSYEWEGKSVPDFAMNLMGFMQANKMEVGTIQEAYADDEFACKTCKEHNPELYDKNGKKKKSKKEEEDAGEGSQVHCKNCKKTKDKCDCGDWQPVPYKTRDQKENKTK